MLTPQPSSSFPSWATAYVLRHTATSLMAQCEVPVTAAAAALGQDPAVFLRTCSTCIRVISKRWPTQWTLLVVQLVNRVTTPVLEADPGECRAWISPGWLVEPTATRIVHWLSCTFASGCRDLNPGPLDPQSSALTKLRHSPSLLRGCAAPPFQALQLPQ